MAQLSSVSLFATRGHQPLPRRFKADLIAYDGYLYNTGLWVVQRVKEKIFLSAY